MQPRSKFRTQNAECRRQKERPILFSGEMVRAILDGKKTQTRRVLKGWVEYHGCLTGDCPHDSQKDCDAALREVCPYGQAVDRLWVRETWRVFGGREYEYQREPKAVQFRATDIWPYTETHDACDWRPSIFMPRWASRIDLEILKIRVERVREISEEDACAEGLRLINNRYRLNGYGLPGWEQHECRYNAVDAYARLWDLINAKRGYGWNVNPWVWVVEFSRREK